MSSGFKGPSVDCRVCGETYPANSPTCPRCGYTPQASTPKVTPPRRPRIPMTARRRLSTAAVVVVLIGMLLPLAAGVLVYRSVTEDVAGGAVEETQRTPVGARECRRIMTRYLRQLLASLNDPDELSRILIDASNEFGPSSGRFQSFASIVTDPEIASRAVQGNTTGAMRRARPAITEACSS